MSKRGLSSLRQRHTRPLSLVRNTRRDATHKIWRHMSLRRRARKIESFPDEDAKIQKHHTQILCYLRKYDPEKGYLRRRENLKMSIPNMKKRLISSAP